MEGIFNCVSAFFCSSYEPSNTVVCVSLYGDLEVTKSVFLWLWMQLFDTRSLEVLKTYQAEARVNAAAISPLLDHVSEPSVLPEF